MYSCTSVSDPAPFWNEMSEFFDTLKRKNCFLSTRNKTQTIVQYDQPQNQNAKDIKQVFLLEHLQCGTIYTWSNPLAPFGCNFYLTMI